MKDNHQGGKFGKNATDEQALNGAEPVLGEPAKTENSTVDGNNKASAGGFDYSPKKVEGHGSSVKQESIAKAIAGDGASGAGGGFAPYGSKMRGISYSGTDARIIDNASGTPSFNKNDRSDSRYGQKTDNTARHINYVPSETYLIGTDGPKSLSEAPDDVQGSLGHPANEFALIQKCSEGFPGALNFERSLDEITDDILLDTEGQQIEYSTTGESYADIDPTKTYDKETNETVEHSLHRGNYIPRTVHVRYSDSGELLDFYYDEDKAKVQVSGDLQTERACTHTITAANRAEIDRQGMALKAGNEVDAKWSPVPYAYPEPTRDVLYLSTLEKMVGAQVFVATKMAAKAHSYQLCKAAKDGLRPVSGGVELALGPTFVRSESAAYDRFSFDKESAANSVFNVKFTSKGAPSAIVKMLDSVAKYHDRGDLLNQPRSFNMVLKQALSNYKQFRIDPKFAKVFDNVNVFSTIDRAYDPSAPVCIMDTIGLKNPYSLNELGSCFRTAEISDLIEENLNSAGKSALYAGNVNKIDTCAITAYATKPIFITMDTGDVEDLVLSNEIIDAAAKLVRRYAAKNFGHEMFTQSYVVPILKKAESAAQQSSHVRLLVFTFADAGIATTDSTPDIKFYFGSSSETDTANSANFLFATEAVYNDYLAVYYHNRQNYYYVELRDPYTDGIKKWLRMNSGLALKVTKDNCLDWPIHYSTKSFSAYSYLVMMSLKFIQEQRAKGLIDVLNYEANFGYPFSDSEPLTSYEALGGTQYAQSDIFERLDARQMTPAIALRWTHPELYTKLRANRDEFRTLFPFYVNEDNFEFSHPNSSYKLSLDYDRAAMSYPVTKHGVRWSYSDDLYAISQRDLRLLLDCIIAPPSFNGADSATYNTQPEVYKYSQASEGLVVVPADVTQQALMETAREIGYTCPVVGGYLFPEPCMKDDTYLDPTSVNFQLDSRCNSSESIVGHSSFRAVCWVIETGNPASSILSQGSSIISRAANFSQKYYIFNTNEENPGATIGLCLTTDSLVNPSAQGGVDGISEFSPFTDGIFAGTGETQLTNFKVFTYAKGLWTRLQKLPFAYNPFDFGGLTTTDPYSFNYLFGLLGFRSSDFKEDLYNRLTKRMADGWKYISDPFVEASLLIK